MPEAWVPPDVYFRYRGFIVYHVYKNDRFEDCTRECWFTLTATGTDSDGHDPTQGTFDIRDLDDDPPEDYRPADKDDDRRKIMFNIDQGYFDDWEHDEEGGDERELQVPLSLLRDTVDYLASCVAGADLNEPDPDRRESGVNEYLKLKGLVDAEDNRLRSEYYDADQATPKGQGEAEQPAGGG